MSPSSISPLTNCSRESSSLWFLTVTCKEWKASSLSYLTRNQSIYSTSSISFPWWQQHERNYYNVLTILFLLNPPVITLFTNLLISKHATKCLFENLLLTSILQTYQWTQRTCFNSKTNFISKWWSKPTVKLKMSI